ncbi:hypothetical protein DQ04_05641040, partial [Trypanosoma grayi]|uniref:hypothetical protein n=1 Tax=Trypanosoma grayi TaxID=71804 RepID=UPI0004F47252
QPLPEEVELQLQPRRRHACVLQGDIPDVVLEHELYALPLQSQVLVVHRVARGGQRPQRGERIQRTHQRVTQERRLLQRRVGCTQHLAAALQDVSIAQQRARRASSSSSSRC